MNIKNCRNCGRIFNYVAGPVICPSCKDSLEAKFQQVKDYIRENKGVGMNEVAEACDVDPAQIRQWLREERLEVTADSQMVLTCESCGEPIRCGRFCEKCKLQVQQGFKEMTNAARPAAETKPKTDPSQSAKMRFLK